MFTFSVQNCRFSCDPHTDAITRLRYINDLRLLVSSSSDGKVCFYDPKKRSISRYYTGHLDNNTKIKSGVVAFSYSAKGKYMISGGTGRVIIIWDPYTVSKIISFSDLSSPVIDVEVVDDLNQIIITLKDKSILAWNSTSFEVAHTYHDSTHYVPEDQITSMLIVPETGLFYTAGHRVTLWTDENNKNNFKTNNLVPLSDEEPAELIDGDLAFALTNKIFSQVVLITTLGKVETFQSQTGIIIIIKKTLSLSLLSLGKSLIMFHTSCINHEIYDAENVLIYDAADLKRDPVTNVILPIVKHACFDQEGTRLIILTYSGLAQFWNFLTGQCLSSISYYLHDPKLSTTMSIGSSSFERASIDHKHNTTTHASSKPETLILSYGVTNDSDDNDDDDDHNKPSMACVMIGSHKNSYNYINIFKDSGSKIENNPIIVIKLGSEKSQRYYYHYFYHYHYHHYHHYY